MSGSRRLPIPGVRPTIVDVHPYVSGKTIEQVKRELGLDEEIKHGSNENPHAPFPEALKAMTEALGQIHTYPESSFVELRNRIAELYDLTADHIAIAHGAGGMLETIARMFIQPGDEVVLPDETYGLYREISRFMGAEIRAVPLTAEYRVDVAGLIAAITPRTKVVWLCNPNNPTGTVATQRDLQPILDALPEDGWLVLDEAYAEFADATQLPDWSGLVDAESHGAGPPARIIVVRTFSKAYGLAGARLGYAIAAPETIGAIDTVAEPFNANRVGIAGALATLQSGMDSVRTALGKITAERARLERELTALGARVTPSQTNFVFFELPEGGDAGPNAPPDEAAPADEVARQLLHRGVIVRSCAGWGYPRHLRVSVGTAAENTRFLAELHTQEVSGG
ncbi:MAG: histidinol-phosphate transaminase [Spirochaeta sp.]|jgi:histidinol-phosphate aminotransferase|nr:histidinol-phosphate transaminase [Spirochaeta sp.]